MDKIIKIFMVPLLCLCLFGCALPSPEEQDQDFVSQTEIEVVSLAREGLNYTRRSRLVDAELKFRQALYLAPGLEPLKHNLAVVLDRQGLFEEADAIYRELLERNPRSIRTLSGIAHVHMKAESFEKAEEYYLRALQIAFDENLPDKMISVSRSLSVLHFLQGREEDSYCWSLFAFKQNPEGLQAYRHARLQLALGDVEEVRTLVEPLATGPSPDPRLATTLGTTYFALGEYEKSQEYVSLLLERKDLAPGLSYNLELLGVLNEYKLRDPEEEKEEILDDEEDPNAIFDTEPLSSDQALYWPEEMLSTIETLELARKAELEERNKSLLWYSPTES